MFGTFEGMVFRAKLKVTRLPEEYTIILHTDGVPGAWVLRNMEACMVLGCGKAGKITFP